MQGPSKCIDRAEVKGKYRNEAKTKLKALVQDYNNVPPYWLIFEGKLRIHELSAQDQKYQEVEKEFMKTMAGAKVMKIELVMHRTKYQDFLDRKNKLIKEGYPPLTRNLFHGSAQEASFLINDENGLDPQYSGEGMWGRAVYFAERADYSNAYAKRLPDQSRQMLYC